MRTRNAIAFVIAFGTLCAVPFLSRADTASDLQAQIASQNAAIAALDTEIAGYQSQLTTIGKNKDTLQNTIKTLTLEATNLKANIALTQKEIDDNTLKIQSLGDSITQTQATVQSLQAAVAESIRTENEQDSDTLAAVLASQKNIAAIWQAAGQEAEFRDNLQSKVDELVATKQNLLSSQAQATADKASLTSLASQLKDQNAITQKTVSDKTTLLAQTKGQEAAYQKLVSDKEALKDQMESDERDYESKLKFILNPSSLPPAGSSPLAWPLDNIIITQLFGKTVDAARLYTNGTHNGVDFGTPVGTPVRAMADGVIVGSGNTDLTCPKASYGMWIYIKYDNGLSSLYGHLSLIKSSMVPGTRVDASTVVAYSGMTGYATGPHLHVTIIAAAAGSIQSFPSAACKGKIYTAPVAALNAYLDPMLYLPKPTKAEDYLVE